MKKLILICLVFVTIACFVACNNQTSSLSSQTETTTLRKEITPVLNSLELPINSLHKIEYVTNFSLSFAEVINFSSSDESCVSVDALGIIRAVGYGVCFVELSYQDIEVLIEVSVSKYYRIIEPNKTIYKFDEPIDTFGGKLQIYDIDETLVEEISINNSMIIDQFLGESGYKIISIDYQGIIYSYSILRLSEQEEDILFDDFISLNQSVNVGELWEFALLKGDTLKLLENIDNVYDYQEIKINAYIKDPNNHSVNIMGFWYQDFDEVVTETTINPNLRLEGYVNDTEDDYDILLEYIKTGIPHFRIRYLPEVVGLYQITVLVEVNGVIIQRFSKSYEVSDSMIDYLGFVRVDESNKKTLVFDDSSSYIPIGQNVGWYTSAQRKYYDYRSWFPNMSDVGMNYARVWMAAWGFSIFWDDLYVYDSRQSNMYSLDKTLELAKENGIYIQLCLLHHGMFSKEVNPMWPASSNTWYTSRYGSNPYADIIDEPGQFFTDQNAIDLFKNQLNYIIARYAYSNHIMAFEIFNEADWIESYQATSGLAWHQEIADYIKSIDPYNHLVTTSLAHQNFTGNNYKVFNLKNIDFVNVHHYGIYDHLETLPKNQYFLHKFFAKPVIYSEVGFSGNGGDDQYQKDPLNLTLHQALWGSVMGGGLGSVAHWWWDSWVEKYDSYHIYQGIATYASKLDLSGSDLSYLNSRTNNSHLTINNISLAYMGYLFNDRIYLYVYDQSYLLYSTNTRVFNSIEISEIALEQGYYKITYHNTSSGSVIKTDYISVTQENFTITLPNFNKDIAIIIEIID